MLIGLPVKTSWPGLVKYQNKKNWSSTQFQRENWCTFQIVHILDICGSVVINTFYNLLSNIYFLQVILYFFNNNKLINFVTDNRI